VLFVVRSCGNRVSCSVRPHAADSNCDHCAPEQAPCAVMQAVMSSA
jgi:hypothetical protein